MSGRPLKLGFVAMVAIAMAGCTTPQAPHPGALSNASATPTVPARMQYLYGSGEAAAISLQAWRGLVSYVQRQLASPPADSVVLAAGATLAAPSWVPCGAKPKAVVFDVDETVLLNLGFEYDDARHPGRPYDEARWQTWERTGGSAVAATPGARKALDVLRAMGVTVVFNTNRSAGNAAATSAALVRAGLGPAVHGDTLYLAGDDANGSHKDGRRAMIATRYCVLAMGGDQLGDFSDLFNAGLAPAARREAALTAPLAAKFGAGWFVLPNPVYGSGLKGGFDDVFPADKRWPADAAK